MFATETLPKIAGAMFALAYVPYIAHTIRGKNQPSKSSWLIWAVLGVTLAFGYNESTRNHQSIWMPLAGAIGPTLTLITVIRYSKDKWSKQDAYYITGAALAIGISKVTGVGLVALVSGIIADCFGGIAIVKSAYNQPGREDKLSWPMWCAASVLQLAAIPERSFAAIAYPLYLAVGTGSICFLIFVRPLLVRQASRTNV